MMMSSIFFASSNKNTNKNKNEESTNKSFESLIINRRCVDDTIELGNLKLIIAIAYPETKDYNVTNIDYMLPVI